jgi:hypothetical protein
MFVAIVARTPSRVTEELFVGRTAAARNSQCRDHEPRMTTVAVRRSKETP